MTRKVNIEEDWIDFIEDDKVVGGFGFIPEEEDYKWLEDKWLHEEISWNQLLNFVKAICDIN